MSQNGEATIDRFSFNPAASTGGFDATVRLGGFRYVSGELGKFSLARTHSQISTPAGVIGVRGTTIEAVIVGNRIQIRVTDGNISFSQTINGSTTTTDLGTGSDEMAEISLDGPRVILNNVPESLQNSINQLRSYVQQAEANSPAPGTSTYSLEYDEDTGTGVISGGGSGDSGSPIGSEPDS